MAHNFFAALRNVVAMTFEWRSGSFERRDFVRGPRDRTY